MYFESLDYRYKSFVELPYRITFLLVGMYYIYHIVPRKERPGSGDLSTMRYV